MLPGREALEDLRYDDAVVTYVRAHGLETGNPVSKVFMRVAGRVCLSVSGACVSVSDAARVYEISAARVCKCK